MKLRKWFKILSITLLIVGAISLMVISMPCLTDGQKDIVIFGILLYFAGIIAGCISAGSDRLIDKDIKEKSND